MTTSGDLGELRRSLAPVAAAVELAERRFEAFTEDQRQRHEAFTEDQRQRHEAFTKQLFEKQQRDHEEFVREIAARLDVAGQRQDALFQHLIEKMDSSSQRVIDRLETLTEATWRMIERLGDGPHPAS